MPAKKQPTKRRNESFKDFYKRRTSEFNELGLTSYIGKAIQIGWGGDDNPRFVCFDNGTLA